MTSQITIINHENAMRSTVRDIIRRAKHFCFSSKQLNEAYSEEILNSAIYAQLPRYAKTYIQGYYDCMRDAYWDNVKWVMPFNGKLYEHFTELPEDGKELYRQKNITGFHVYISNEKKHYTGNKNKYLTGLKE